MILCDENGALGGSLLDERANSHGGTDAASWLRTSLTQLAALPHVTLLPRTTVFGYFPHNMLGLCERITDHLAMIAPA